MRESIGGAWLFGIVIVFIFMFASFMAYSVSYSKAFSLKNEIISIIEENEGFTKYKGSIDNLANSCGKGNSSTECKIYDFMKTIGYNLSANISCDTANKEYAYDGYCLKCTSGVDGNKFTTYKVTTFMSMEIPFLGINVNMPVSGETRVIYNGTCPD